MIEPKRKGNVLPKRFQLHLLGSIEARVFSVRYGDLRKLQLSSFFLCKR